MLATWEALPDARLAPVGVASADLIAAGCQTLRAAGRFLHGLPYGRNGDRGDWRLVVEEGRGTCSTKHALLCAAARENDLDVSLTVGIYLMGEANTPGVGPVLAAHGLEAIPEAHCYGVVGGRRVDVTRSGVEPREPIAGFEQEWPISPDDIGIEKVRLHRGHLATWLAGGGAPGFDLDGIWAVREACIAALAQDER